MSIQAIQLPQNIMALDFQGILDRRLKAAVEQMDLSSIKKLIDQGASPNINIETNYQYNLDSSLLAMFNDKEYFTGVLYKKIDEMDDDDPVARNYYIISDGMQSSWDAEEFVNRYTPECREAIREIILCSYNQTNELDDIIGQEETVLLFEFALQIKDLNLIKKLLEKDVLIQPQNWSAATFFPKEHFTQKNIEIIETVLSSGFSLQDLLAKDETFESILEAAEITESQLLVSYLEEHNIYLEERCCGRYQIEKYSLESLIVQNLE